MWVNKTAYLELYAAWQVQTTGNRLLGEQVVALNTTLDWFRVRISQLEHERAVMLKKYLDIDVPVQVVERQREASSLNAYHMTADFNDMGDAAAKSLGIGWDADTGVVTYGLPETN